MHVPKTFEKFWSLDMINTDMGWQPRQVGAHPRWRPGTAATLHFRAESNRKKGISKPGDLPPPDLTLAELIKRAVNNPEDAAAIQPVLDGSPPEGRLRDDAPLWSDESYQSWKASRPGRGGGGGGRRRTSPGVDPATLPSDWWHAEHVAGYLGIQPRTWHSYVSRNRAPKPEEYQDNRPVWRPETIKKQFSPPPLGG